MVEGLGGTREGTASFLTPSVRQSAATGTDAASDGAAPTAAAVARAATPARENAPDVLSLFEDAAAGLAADLARPPPEEGEDEEEEGLAPLAAFSAVCPPIFSFLPAVGGGVVAGVEGGALILAYFFLSLAAGGGRALDGNVQDELNGASPLS